VALATTHLPLKDVPAAITQDVARSAPAHPARRHARKYGIAAAAHPGRRSQSARRRGRLPGAEEIEVITPVLEKLRGEGMTLLGPLPADTMFTPPMLAQGDACWPCITTRG
jgi:4-hydroxythreonine-4-phosphate dehydrogenase